MLRYLIGFTGIGKDSVCLKHVFSWFYLREMFEERSFFKMETKRSKQLCFGFALLVLILELQVSQLPGPSCTGTEQFSTKGTNFNVGNSLSHSNVLLEQIFLSDVHSNSSFTGEKIEQQSLSDTSVAPYKLNVLFSSHLSAFSLFGSFLCTSLAEKFPYYPAILNNSKNPLRFVVYGDSPVWEWLLHSLEYFRMLMYLINMQC